MAVTFQVTRLGRITTVTVTSSLSGTVYFHWFLDGAYLGMTISPTRTFVLGIGEQARVEVLDTTDADYDPVANAPAAYPARRTLWWVRSLGDDVDYYRIDQDSGSGWTEIARVAHLAGAWEYRHLTARLVDLTDYQWRVVPVDSKGNEGTALELETERIVRTPDSPNFTITFDEGTDRVTFAAA